MINITNKEDCSGCCACIDICSHKAITLEIDKEGFWYPSVNETLCTDCGLCDKICPDLNILDLKKNDLEQPECYVAINKNLEVRFDSTSGGIFSSFADKIYKEKGYVGGAIFNEDFSVSHHISNDKNDLPALRSSKYLQSDASGLYKRVRGLVRTGEKVLVCGCPCQMAGLRSFLMKDYENLIIVDFICRGINSPKVFRKYLDYLEDRFQSKVVYFKAKNKELGWRKLTSKIVFDNKKAFYDTVDTSYFTQGYLHTGVYSRPSCYTCKYKGFPRIADITIADFWGVENISDKEYDNDLGTSLVLLNSKKGIQFYESIKGDVKTTRVPFESILPGNKALIDPLNPPLVDRADFYDKLDKKSFKDVAQEFIKPTSANNGFVNKKLKPFAKRVLQVKRTIGFNLKPLSQFLRYNFFHKALQTNFLNNSLLYPTKHTILQIDKKANVLFLGAFVFGYKRFKKSKLESRLLVEKNGTLKLNGDFNLAYGAAIEVFSGANLEIGHGGATNINTTIICGDSITIGNGVIMGRNVTIRDNNGNHFISRRGYKNSRPVVIGDHVWLCEGCTIMPGVKIGDGAIVSAGSLVISNVPANTLVSGNPAVVVDEDVYWKY